MLDQQTPEPVGSAAPLWSRRAGAELIHQEFGIRMPVRTVGQSLRRWGYTPKRPARKAWQQNPEAVRRGLKQSYPGLVRRAAAEGATILWCDEMGIGIDEFSGRGYARRGATPRKEVSGSRTRVHVVSALTHRGEGHFQTDTGTLDGPRFLEFLGRLLEEVKGKLFLVLDHLSVHERAEVEAWVAAHRRRIELIPLPTDAPELNPVEYLNQDAKAQVNAEGLPKTQKDLKINLEVFLENLRGLTERIMSYFQLPAVHYAANPM